MAVYLVDFENVTSAGISGIQRLTKEDKVYIFYTVNASNMSFAAHMNLLSSPAEVIYYNVTSGGKNALDFQLSSFLGYLVSRGEDKEFYIISNDKGYDHVKSFWEKSGITQDVTINSSPSINRSLLPLEKPFSATKIQQQNQQPAAPLQGSVSSAALEQLKAETDRYTAQKAAAEAEAAKAAVKEAVEAKPEEETPAPKKRGRPRKQKPEETVAAQAAQPAEAPAKIAQPSKAPKPAQKPADKNKAASSGKARAKSAPEALKQAIKPLLAKAGVKSEEELVSITAYFNLADGKQQFYRNLIALYGMERGVEVYRVIRSEYTNLTKLIKR